MKQRLKEHFKALTECVGISGVEQEVVRYMVQEFEKTADEVTVDPHGNVIAMKKGRSDGKSFMIASHMDEVGFVVKNIDANGFIYFDKVGTASNKVMEGRKVWIKDRIPGIIGIKNGHLMSPEEKSKVLTPRKSYIDVGAFSKEEVEALGIGIGDQIVLQSRYQEMSNPDLITTRAVDDRIGCSILLTLFENLKSEDFEGTIYAVATVQEEIGMRGAEMVANRLKPDYALAVDTVPAGDTPDSNLVKELPVRLGQGPVSVIADGVMSAVLLTRSHIGVLRAVDRAAHETGNKVQKITLSGEGYATDSAKINSAGFGTPVSSLAIPRRYSHAPVELVHMNDVVAAYEIILQMSKNNNEINLNFLQG